MLQPKLIRVEPLDALKLRLEYETGEIKVFDAAPYATGMWFGELKDRAYFRTVQVLPDGSLRMRVWERGAAVTLACGTGACASVVAASLTGRLAPSGANRSARCASVQLDGGRLWIEWAENDHVYMTGPAERVFAGTYGE